MNTSLIKANEAFFASSACVAKNNGSRPPRVRTLHTWNVYRASREAAKEKGERKEKKKNPFGFIRLSQEA